MTGPFYAHQGCTACPAHGYRSLSGCFGEEEIIPEPVPVVEEDPRIFVTDRTGASIDNERRST